MAISGTHYQLLRSLAPRFQRHGSLLEIGEANWYGEIEPPFPVSDGHNLFSVAKECYAHLFAPEHIVSIDAGGTPAALRLDLNQPIALNEQFDVVINHGTAEHVFDVAQLFRTIHAHCVDGGWMIHESPFTGWRDHGFYCLQPTLFYDLAAVNNYEVALVAAQEIEQGSVQIFSSRDDAHRLTFPENTMLFVAFKKYGDAPFRVPFQGYYARTLSEAGKYAWENAR